MAEASCQTKEWVSTAPYVTLTVYESSSTASTATLRWKLDITYESKPDLGPNTSRDFTIKVDGQTVADTSYNLQEKTGTYRVIDGYLTVNKGTSSRAVGFSVTFDFNLTWSGVHKDEMSASGSLNIAAKSSYTVSYNANGGTGAPGSQTKNADSNITLSSTKPTRAGYTFKGWGTSSSDTTVDYNPGATYSANASITLYAIWTPVTYIISYNANSGTGAPENQTKTHGQTLTLSGTKPTKTDYSFKGWATSPSSATATYLPGGTYTANSSITLYAVWSLDYTAPRLTSVSVVGNIDASGLTTTLQVGFAWSTDKNVTSVKVEWEPTGGANPDSEDGTYTHTNSYTFTAAEASGTSGTVDKTFSDYSLNPDVSYTVTITVSDASGSSSTSRMFIGNVFPIDVLPENRGIAFGKSAELDNYMDVGYYTLFRHESLSYHSDVAYAHIHEKSGLRVAFGYGAGGANHGIWDDLHGRWIFYNNGKDTFIGDAHGNLRPYFRPGDYFTIRINTGGFCASSAQFVNFVIPLSKPLMAVSSITVSSADGIILRSNGKYSHGSDGAADPPVRVFPNSYNVSKNSAGFIQVQAVFSNTTNATNNCAIGVDASITVTFN